MILVLQGVQWCGGLCLFESGILEEILAKFVFWLCKPLRELPRPGVVIADFWTSAKQQAVVLAVTLSPVCAVEDADDRRLRILFLELGGALQEFKPRVVRQDAFQHRSPVRR